MTDNTTNNKRIIGNTIIIYLKLIISTILTLLISRYVLIALGEEDFGLYTTIGGVVILFNILATTMISTSYRYIAVETGKKQSANLNKTYNTILLIHICLAVLLLIIGETIGIFYVKNILNVAPDKINIALKLLHISLLSSAFVVVSVPALGLITANERFLYTSLIEIFNTIIRFILVVILISYDGNKLIGYAWIMFLYSVVPAFSYMLYTKIKYPAIVKWKINKNIDDYKSIAKFSSWILMGAIACQGRVQGAALIINYFFGNVLNAAFGIASQVSHCCSMFVGSISKATNPQIMKSQGGDNKERSVVLIYSISKISYFTLLIISIPLLICIDEILIIWLKKVPLYTSIFVILLIANSLVACLGSGFDACIQATGNIKKNQIGYSIINISLIPIVLVLYMLGCPAYTNMIVMLILTIVTLIFQISILQELTTFSVRKYYNFTIKPTIICTTISFIPLYLLHQLFITQGMIRTIIFGAISLLYTIIVIYFIGLSKKEQDLINHSIFKLTSRIK